MHQLMLYYQNTTNIELTEPKTNKFVLNGRLQI